MKDWWNECVSEAVIQMLAEHETLADRDVQSILKVIGKEGEKLNILDIASGVGRHLRAWSAAGHHATGIELHQDIIDEILRRSEGFSDIQVIKADMRSIPLEDENFDVVECLWNSFGFFSEMDNVKVLREMNRLLKNGGYMLIHSWNPSLFNTSPSRSWKYIGESYVLLSETSFDFVKSRLIVSDTYLNTKTCSKEFKVMNIRQYYPSEFITMLNNFGIHDINILDGFSYTAASQNSSSFLIVAHKTE